jgi:hypothetical protein
VVCTHWFSAPFGVLGTELEDPVVRFLERHTRDLIRLMGLRYRHISIVCRVSSDECLERLITNMDGREIGIHHILMYTQHLMKIPNTYRITIPYDGMDIKYICERMVDMVQTILHGF